ncbi:MAG TPA: hypothetical protein PLG59_00975 [bacterium]|mgnify:CR=1 FL=1|nr:hypothetical protein [bacterium]HQO33202.1 hypothetical protein [bacterium]HQP99689.1 hypothetical protein [bacterium]
MNKRIFAVFFACIVLILPAFGQEKPAAPSQPPSAPQVEQPAAQPQESRPLTVDDFGADLDLEVRVLLGQKAGLVGALPPDLNDMRDVLQDRFNYTTYSLWNTLHVVAWPGEQTVVQVVPGHYLAVETLAADAARGIVKARVSVCRDEGEPGVRREFLAGQQGAVEVAQQPRHSAQPPDLLSSPMTVTRTDWKAIGGVELWLSADGERLRSTLPGKTLMNAGNSEEIGQTKRFLIVAVKIVE